MAAEWLIVFHQDKSLGEYKGLFKWYQIVVILKIYIGSLVLFDE